MPKRSEKVRKLLHVFVFLVLAALLLFAFFAFMTVRTNVNFLTGAIDVLRGMLSGSSAASLEGMQKSVSEIFRTVPAHGREKAPVPGTPPAGNAAMVPGGSH